MEALKVSLAFIDDYNIDDSIYHDVADNEVQLLDLHPHQDFNAPIQASLHIVEFSNMPVYEAMSYVWGDPKVTSTIFVSGLAFYTTTNLVSALRRLQSEYDIKVSWVDAVCINQKNVKKRNDQVQMIARIYKGAEQLHGLMNVMATVIRP